MRKVIVFKHNHSDFSRKSTQYAKNKDCTTWIARLKKLTQEYIRNRERAVLKIMHKF